MADSPQWPALSLRAALARQASVLMELADKMVLGDESPSQTPGDFRNLVRSVVDLVSRHLPSAPDRHLKHVAGLFADLGEHLRYIERSQVQQTPWSLIPALDLFVRSRVSSEGSFIYRPKWAYNYAINGEFVSVYREAIDGFSWIPVEERAKSFIDFAELDSGGSVVNIKRPIYTVSFPRVERLNVLLHTNLGHEFGHLVAHKWLKQHFTGFWNSIESEVRTQNRRHVSSILPPTTSAQTSLFRQWTENEMVEDRVGDARAVAEQGLKELISDSVGAYFFGPSALLAAADVAARYDLDESPIRAGGYPPWRFRLRLIYEQLKEDIDSFSSVAVGWCDEYIETIGDIREAASQSTDIGVLRNDTRTSFVYEQIKSNWKSFYSSVLSFLPCKGGQPYRISKRLEELRQLGERLQDLVPPNETGRWDRPKPADMRDIITVGWVHVAASVKNQSAKDSIGHIENIHRLVLKAIETSHWSTRVDKD